MKILSQMYLDKEVPVKFAMAEVSAVQVLLLALRSKTAQLSHIV